MAFKDDNGKTNYKPILGLSTDQLRKVVVILRALRVYPTIYKDLRVL